MPQYDYLIVGSGLFGAVFARQLTDEGRKCLVIDKRAHSGGNCFTQTLGGIDVHRYGPHIFHTNSQRIWNYIQKFASFYPYRHKVKARCGPRGDGGLYSLPINLATLHQLWGVTTPQEAREKLDSVRENIPEPANLEEWALSRLGQQIYELFIRGYTTKQWGRSPRDLPASILQRLPVRLNFNDDYYEDTFQGIPIGGYTPIFEKLLEGVDLRLDTDFFADRRALESCSSKIVYTGMIDRYFDYRHGPLDWRSLRFQTADLPIEDFQGGAIVNYCDAGVPFTRITEFKHFQAITSRQRGHTVITREFPQAWSMNAEPYYPINSAANEARLAEYRRMTPAKVIFGGRLGDYKYYDMDQVIGSALAKAQRESGERKNIPPEARADLTAIGWRPGASLNQNRRQELNHYGENTVDQTITAVTAPNTSIAQSESAGCANFCLVTPDGRLLANNLILHADGRIFTDHANLHARSWVPLARLPGTILCGGITWNRSEEDYVTANFGALSTQRFRRQVARLRQLPGRCDAAWRGQARLRPQRRLPRSRENFEIVVAKYKEDVAWTQCYPNNVTIYCKDPDDRRFIPLPNVGREYGTYLHHIVSRYDSLAERTLFVQGDPFFHRLLPVADFAFSEDQFQFMPNMHHSMAQLVNWGWPDQTVDGSVKAEFLELLERPADIQRFSFTWGAQFAVSRGLIRRNPISYYRKLYEISQLPDIRLAGRRFDNLHIGFMFEFFWQNIFCPERADNRVNRSAERPTLEATRD